MSISERNQLESSRLPTVMPMISGSISALLNSREPQIGQKPLATILPLSPLLLLCQLLIDG